MQDPTAAALQAIKPHFPEQEQLKCPRCDSTNTKFCYYNNYNLSQPRHFCKNCRRYWTKGGSLRNIPVGGGSRKSAKRSTNQKRANPEPNPESTRTNRRPPESASPTSTPAPGGTAETPAPQFMGYENSGSGREPVLIYGLEKDPGRKVVDVDGSFTFGSLLTSNSQFGNIFDQLNSNRSRLKMVPMGGFVEDLNSVSHSGSGPQSGLDVQGGNKTTFSGGLGGVNSESNLQHGEWGNSNGGPDLAIYTPGSSRQWRGK